MSKARKTAAAKECGRDELGFIFDPVKPEPLRSSLSGDGAYDLHVGRRLPLGSGGYRATRYEAGE
jgi:hypothetical protein